MIFRKSLLLFLLVLPICFVTELTVGSEGLQSATAEITDINVGKAGSFTEILIYSNQPLSSYTIYKPEDPYRLVVELQGVEIGKFKDKIVIDRAGVMEIIPSKVEGDVKTVRLDIILTVPAEVKPQQKEKALILTFYNPEAEEIVMAPEEEPVSAEVEKELKVPETKVVETKAPSAEEELQKAMPFTSNEYVGEKISLDFQDANLIHIFRLLADVSGYNIVVSPQVAGKFSMKLTNVPWDQALDTILRNYGLSKSVEGNIIRIAPTAVIAQEEEEIARAKEAKLKSGDLETRVYAINYADVKKIQDAIKDAKTERGKVNIDERTSTVIIKDVAGAHKEIEQIIKSLDLPTQQVNIEARIVEATTSFTKEFGIQWGALWLPPGSRTVIGGPSIPGGTGGMSSKIPTTGTAPSNPLMVNLPAAVTSGAGGAIGVGYISSSNNFLLDLQLSAMESAGKGKIISNPRITTLDNQQAKIQQGKKIPYQTVSAEGTETEFVDANLELIVTPHVTPEGTIVMDIEAKKNEASEYSVGGVPAIDTKEAKTKILIKDGDTLVIGGIFKTTSSKTLAGVPGLSKIPILGWLFKKKLEKESTDELLIFITPRIIK